MTMPINRRALLAAAGAAALARPGLAQNGTVIQENQGDGVPWLPVISSFYVKPEQGEIFVPPDDGPPQFPPDEINPPLHFTLFPPPLDATPTVDTDIALMQKRMENGEAVSAWMLGRDHGVKRIYAHRVYDEEYLAGYPVNERVQVRLGIDILRESFVPPNPPPRPERAAYVRSNIRFADGEVRIGLLNGVNKRGLGGSLEEGSETILKLVPKRDAPADSTKKDERPTLASFDNYFLPLPDFIPRRPTEGNGDLFDGVVQVKTMIVLEAGKELGFAEPNRKVLTGELRIGIGKTYLEIMQLNKDWQKK